jgi:hypothetical protein
MRRQEKDEVEIGILVYGIGTSVFGKTFIDYVNCLPPYMTLLPLSDHLLIFSKSHFHNTATNIPINMAQSTLSPLDLSMPNSYAHQTLFFRTTSARCVETLKTALEATCRIIPVINGQLLRGEHGRPPVVFHRQYPVREMLTIHDLTSDVDYEDLKHACIDPSRTRSRSISKAIELLSIIPPYSIQTTKEVPVVRLTIAQLEGGLALTLNFHHLVFDMASMGVFLRILATYCRGEKPSNLPADCLSRDILSNVPKKDYEHHLAALNDRIKPVIDSSAEETIKPSTEQAKSPPFASANFHFSMESLKSLKAVVMATVKQSGVLGWVSTHDALFALMWSCISQASSQVGQAKDKDTSTICMAVNLRRRLDPPLPDDYLGAAVCAPSLSAPVELLNSASTASSALAQLSLLIRAKVKCIDAEYVRRCFDTTSSPLGGEQDPPAFMPKGPIDFTINSWAGQGACEHNWGPDLGTCELVTRLYARSPCVYVMPKLPNGGGLYVYTALEPETMTRLKEVDLLAKYAIW